MKKYDLNDFNFSLIQGGSMYLFNGDHLENPTWGFNEERSYSPIIYEATTGEPFFVKRLRYYEDKMNNQDVYIHKHYIKAVKNPPSSPYIVWPHDLVELNENTERLTSLFLVQSQNLEETDINRDPSKFALLFSTNDIEGMNGLSSYIMLLKRRRQLNYNNPDVRHIIMQIVERLEEFKKSDYVFYDFDFSRFMMDNRFNLYVNFSNLIYHRTEFPELADGRGYLEEPTEIPLDFMEPAFASYNNHIEYANNAGKVVQIPIADDRTVKYNTAAMFFYLMFGRYAYEGGIYNVRDEYSSIETRRDMAMSHIRIPVFIFDRFDNSNAVGDITEEELRLHTLWENCPQDIKDYFEYILSEGFAKRISPDAKFKDWNWKEVLKNYQWS